MIDYIALLASFSVLQKIFVDAYDTSNNFNGLSSKSFDQHQSWDKTKIRNSSAASFVVVFSVYKRFHVVYPRFMVDIDLRPLSNESNKSNSSCPWHLGFKYENLSKESPIELYPGGNLIFYIVVLLFLAEFYPFIKIYRLAFLPYFVFALWLPRKIRVWLQLIITELKVFFK